MRSKARLVLLAAAIAAILTSCQTNKRKTIAVIPKGTSHQFWVSVENGAKKAGLDFNVDIVWSGPAQETEYGRQLEILEAMINRHVDGIVVAAAEKKVLVQAIDHAASAGIPLTVFDSGVETENYVSFVATDNVEAGRMGARELARLLNGKGNIAIMMNMPGSVSTLDRERGFTETIAKEFPNMKVVATQFGMSDRAKAMNAAENILTAQPHLDGIFASSEPSSVGFSQALKARGLVGKIKFVAFDSSESMIEDTKAGVIDAMVVQDPAKMGYEAVRTIVDKLNGKTPPKRINLEAKVLRKDNL